MKAEDLIYQSWEPPMELESKVLAAWIYVSSIYGKPVEVWVKGGEILFDPDEPIEGGELVGVYDAMRKTLDQTAFMQDLCFVLEGAA